MTQFTLRIDQKQLTAAIAAELDGEDPAPITTDDRLDNEEEQRLGQITTNVLSDLFSSETPPIVSDNSNLSVDDIIIEDYRDGEGFLDGLSVTPYLRYEHGERIRNNKLGSFFFDRINRITDLEGAEDLSGQIAAFTQTILGQALYHINAQFNFFTAALTPVEPKTTTLPVPYLDEHCVLVGEAGGHSAVESNRGANDCGLTQIRTEHGLLQLDPDAGVIVLDEPGIPEILTCAHQTHRATLETPAEFCEENALPGSLRCAKHINEEDL